MRRSLYDLEEGMWGRKTCDVAGRKEVSGVRHRRTAASLIFCCALVTALSAGCFTASGKHGWTTRQYEGRMLPISGEPGAARLKIESDFDVSIRNQVALQGNPDYIHVVDVKHVELVYLQDDRVWVCQRVGFTPASSLSVDEPIPQRLVDLLKSDDRRRLLARRGIDSVLVAEPASAGEPISETALQSEGVGVVAHAGQRHALVIGNAGYIGNRLENPLNDARDMGIVLQRLGFDVIRVGDGSHRRMEQAVREFGRRLQRGGVGLFFYAGHAVQVDGENYLLPVDSDVRAEDEVRFKSLPLGLVMEKMATARNELNIVLLDACRDNPFRGFRSLGRGLSRTTEPAGTIVGYATAPGSVAADGKGRNGIYTRHLLRHMQVEGLKIEEVLKRVRVAVRDETSGRQIPWDSSSLTADFYFLPAASEPEKE